MRLPGTVAGFLLACLLSCGAAAADIQPRAVAERVAKAIEDNYYEANRGKRIADDLRTEIGQGKFDAFADPRDLATALTARLSPLDAHFSVRWSAAGGPLPPTHAMQVRRRHAPVNAGATSPAGPPSHASIRQAPPPGTDQPASRPHAFVDAAQRGNFGIRRVEVLPGNVGYIDLRMFANFEFGNPEAPARRAIEAALELIRHTDATLIDLRLNGGGSPAMVGYLSSAFTPNGADIYNTFNSRTGKSSEAPRDWHPSPRLDVPLFLLTSARTGSAAEAFAYTLKNAGRATVVGEASAGAANPGGFLDAGDGFSVFVSDGSPVSPVTGRNWEGTGVEPDFTVPSAAAFDKALELALAASLERMPADAAATDTRWALEAIRARASTATETLAPYAGEYDALAVETLDGRLAIRRGRRPPLMLQPLGKGLFSVEIDSNQRVRFERSTDGRIVALEMLTADGHSSRYLRGSPAR